jgi:hypothetical protein
MLDLAYRSEDMFGPQTWKQGKYDVHSYSKTGVAVT